MPLLLEAFDPFTSVFGVNRGCSNPQNDQEDDEALSKPAEPTNLIDVVKLMAEAVAKYPDEQSLDLVRHMRWNYNELISKSITTAELLEMVLRQFIVNKQAG